jgi:hypothetical protein
MNSKKSILSEAELAAEFGVCRSVLAKGRSSRTGLAADLVYVRLGRRILYRRSDVDGWLERHLIVPAETGDKAPKLQPKLIDERKG